MKIAYSIVKRIRQIVGLLLMSLMSIEVFAYDFEVNGIYYSIKEEIFQDGYYAEVAHGPIKYSGNITIPEMVSYSHPEETCHR